MKLFFTVLSILFCIPITYSFCLENTLSNLLQQRHSGYVYDISKSVSKDQLKRLVEATRLTPSCFNDQPWHFVVSDRNQTPEAYQKILMSLVEFNQGWAKTAPVLVVVLADSKFQKDGKDNRWGPYDAGAAAYAMMLAATDMGLMAHQMGGFNEKQIQSDLKIPNRFIPMAVMAIGYEAEGQTAKPKERKSINDNFFMGTWGQGLSF